MFAEVILPLAVGHTFTYAIPEEMRSEVKPGIRVEVGFGKKRHYAGIVHSTHNNHDPKKSVREILTTLDTQAILYPHQIRLWEWISQYYLCTLGEVMAAALPAALKLSSETRVIASESLLNLEDDQLSENEYRIRELLRIKSEISLGELQEILGEGGKEVINGLIEEELILVFEALENPTTEKRKEFIWLDKKILNQAELQAEAFEKISRSKHQTNALMGILFLAGKNKFVAWEELKNRFDVPRTAVKSLEKKGLLRLESIGLSELLKHEVQSSLSELSAHQKTAYDQMNSLWEEKKVFLLHGVTGSGKTIFYGHKMREILENDPESQILYLLPEIALTSMTLVKLQAIFGEEVMVYHSRITPKERMTSWQKVLKGQRITVGPRSALFLPYRKLSLIIIDEEHDASYYQYERKPHFSARDTAIQMAHENDAHVILGSATPSIETLWKAFSNKFGYLRLSERYGESALPEIRLIDLKKAKEDGELESFFSQEMLTGIKDTIDGGKQVLIFQNRRGHSPIFICPSCHWKAHCINCDIALTYHEYRNRLVCHLCNYSFETLRDCPDCGQSDLQKLGLGTEKIAQELKLLFPHVKVDRLDTETGSRKNAAQEILEAFQQNKTQILVGTQMIAKGLDFEHIGLVGIVLADALMYFPDYRALERAFQLMMQVAGRAGRRKDLGRVMIQCMNIAHPLFKDLKNHDYLAFAERELQERKNFIFPPFCRMVHIEIKHKKPEVARAAAAKLSRDLRKHIDQMVSGPSQPNIARVRNHYIYQIMVKMPLNKDIIVKVKALILQASIEVRKEKGWSGLRLGLYVDP